MSHLKTARFVAPLIELEKWKVFGGLQIHPKVILRRSNKVRNVHEKGMFGAKAREARNLANSLLSYV